VSAEQHDSTLGAKRDPVVPMTPRSILFVAYFYPPTRDTGAHRPASMVRHLRGLGHDVTVLTTRAFGDDDEEGVVRAADLQLARARLRGHDRIDSLFDADTYSGRPHPLSKVIVPEPLAVAWAPFAAGTALRLHRRRPFDCVISSSPPESAHLVARAVQRAGAAWVADLRDAWTFEPLRPEFPTRAQRRADELMERRLLSAADEVVAVSRPVVEDLARRGIADARLIPNGWDPEALDPGSGDEDVAELLDADRTSLVYTGRFGSFGRDPRPFAEALRALAMDDPDAAAKLELVIAGPLTDEEAELFAGGFDPLRVRLAGSLPRERALALQRAANALLLIAQPTRTQLPNFKLFEYLAAGPPILALAAGTEAGRIVAETGAGEAVRADDPEAIGAALHRLVAGELSPPPGEARREYSYPLLAERMSEVVEEVVARRRR
jgi:glycosyltransferase involved in cell wall biosynthesis